jgi:hypothetical protein
MNIFTQYYGFDWLALILGVLAMWGLGDKKRSSFLIYMLATTAGLIFSILIHSIPIIIFNIISFCLQLRGFINWGKDNKNKDG